MYLFKNTHILLKRAVLLTSILISTKKSGLNNLERDSPGSGRAEGQLGKESIPQNVMEKVIPPKILDKPETVPAKAKGE